MKNSIFTLLTCFLFTFGLGFTLKQNITKPSISIKETERSITNVPKVKTTDSQHFLIIPTDPCNDLQCQTNILVINTGYDPISQQAITSGNYDPLWTVCETPNSNIIVPRQAYVVTPNSAWHNQTNTGWISAYPQAFLNSNNPSPNPPYGIKNCFCVCADNTQVTIDLSAYADNNVSIYLEDDAGNFIQQLLSITDVTTGAFRFPPTQSSTTLTLNSGTYCIRADLRNLSGVAMGINIMGTVTGASLLKSICCGNKSSITGTVYNDLNCNASRDFPDSPSNPQHEPPLEGRTVTLCDAGNNILDVAISDVAGFYTFSNLAPGNYIVKEAPLPGWSITQPSAQKYSVTLGPLEVAGSLDFGNFELCSLPANCSDQTYTDANDFVAVAKNCAALFENYDGFTANTQIYSLFNGALTFNSPNIPTIFNGSWNLQGTAGEFSGMGLLPHNPYNELRMDFPTPVFGFGSKVFNDFSGIWEITLTVTTASGQTFSVTENVNTTGDVGFLGATSPDGIISAVYSMNSPPIYAFELDLTRLIPFGGTYYVDTDNDGFGDPGQSFTSCTMPGGYVNNNQDCDDNDPNNYPGNAEGCDGQDNDCDGIVDKADPDFIDNTNPVPVCNNITIVLTPAQTASITPDMVDAGSYDDCSTVSLALDRTDFSCADIGTQIVTLTVEDESGNIDFCTADILVYSSTEICDNLDNDCDGNIDEGFDNDGDNYTICQGDCDDTDPNNYPGNTEICDHQDNNCDGVVDEGFDQDGDGYSVCQNDCNDRNPAIHPGAIEVCDAVDNDCDGQLNEGALLTFYMDADGDGFGNPALSLQHCSPPPGYVPDNTDCNDSNAGVNPAATEICDGMDNNCNGYTDDNDGTLVDTQKPTVACKPYTVVLDANGQKTIVPQDVMLGYTDNCFIVGFSLSKTAFSCADIGIRTVTLTAKDRKGNSASCTTTVTVVDNTPPWLSCKDATVVLDANGMGHLVYTDVMAYAGDACGGISGISLGQPDFTCASIGPNQVTLSVTDIYGNSKACVAVVTVIGNPALFNGIPELCNFKDDNCNGLIDEGFDQDNDGFTTCGGDCDDSNSGINPAATEVCNFIDDNCDGAVDEGFDQDGDGFTTCGGDCKDNNPAINPTAPEVCNGIDDDCNGLVDNGISGATFVGNLTFQTQAEVDAWLQCISIIDGNLSVGPGLDIVDLGPLLNIVKVTGDVQISATGLTNMQGLNSLHTVGRDLIILHNGKLATLDGLENLTSVGRDLAVQQNKISGTSIGLSDCCAIYNLLNSSGIGRSKSIFFNRTGCDNLAEINAACGSGNNLVVPPGNPTSLVIAPAGFQLYPNPATNTLYLDLHNYLEKDLSISIYNHLGQRVLHQTEKELHEPVLSIDLAQKQLPEGFYLLTVRTAEGQEGKQFVVAR